MLLFSGMQVAGQIISQMSGMQLADVFNPGFDANVPVFSQLLFYVALAVFVHHRRASHGDGGAARYVCLAAGGAGRILAIDRRGHDVAARRKASCWAFAPRRRRWWRCCLATLVLGLVSRTLPQLNVMVVGFGFNALVTLAHAGRLAGRAPPGCFRSSSSRCWKRCCRGRALAIAEPRLGVAP